MEKQTIILVSHAMDEVERLCDRLIVLDEGKIIAEGTPAQIIEQAAAAQGGHVASLEDAFVALTGTELDALEED